jgi:spermidine/putrescine transport system substrate-binding protein
MRLYNHRQLHLLTSLITLALLFSACSGGNNPIEAPAGNTQPSSTGPLNVLEWSGYELPEFWTRFAEAHPDVKVDYSFFAEDAEALAKVQSGFNTDVIHPCTSWLNQYSENDLILPIDTTRLSNWKDLNPALADIGKVNGKQYLAPWEWGYESILVRTDKVKEMPDSWADLWDPQYAGHVTIFDSGETAWIITSLALGYDPYNTTPEQQEAIKQKMIELKPNLLNYWTDFTEVIQMVASGDIWVAAGAWPESYLELTKQGIPVEYLEPKEGRMGYVCGFVITKDSPNVDLAYDYINATLDPEAMAFLSNEYGYGASNTKALAMTDPEIIKAMALDDPDIMNRTFFYQPLTDEQRQLFTDTWSQVKAAP